MNDQVEMIYRLAEQVDPGAPAPGRKAPLRPGLSPVGQPAARGDNRCCCDPAQRGLARKPGDGNRLLAPGFPGWQAGKEPWMKSEALPL
jgi:hypothetical protein